MSVVAERIFAVGGRADAARIQLHAPHLDQSHWRCDYTIEWPGYHRQGYAMGVDSWQALKLAMQNVGTDIFVSEDFERGDVGEVDAKVTNYAELTEWLGIRPLKVLEQ
ncbi:MAG TPA: hypothetical protein VG841_01895 [Caulobacterales bacterium]|nr:hypothetical protein [Caulobacterales bacterium]